MEEIEEALVTFIERKESQYETVYLSDIMNFLKECWKYTTEESLGLIEDCIAERYLTIKSIAKLYNFDDNKNGKNI